MKTSVQSIDYNHAPDSLKYDIALILQRVWPEVSLLGEGAISNAHEKELNARSFYLYSEGKLVSYAGVVRKTINLDGHTFNIAGLSCVATDPDYRNQGLGFQVVSSATEWIEQQENIDFGVFTCEPKLSSFYYRAGNWSVMPDVLLIGNKDKDSLSSRSLGVVVLMRLFTNKSRVYRSILNHTTIDLDFPKGQFL